jgi:excinuclease UvrABC helicase subunit UvrB
MLQAAEELRFEEAARQRDRLRQLEAQQLRMGL